MNLKEKLTVKIAAGVDPHNSNVDYVAFEEAAEACEIICDEYALAFVKWMREEAYKLDFLDSKIYTDEEKLEYFKPNVYAK